MEYVKMKGAEIPVTLAQIEAWRETARTAARDDYRAGRTDIMTAVYRIEDIDRAADKARDGRVNAVINRKVAA